MCFSQGNPQKLEYCQWMRCGIWSQYPLLGPMLLNLVIQLLVKQSAKHVSQKALWADSVTCIHCFVENCWIWSQSLYNELLRACRTWPGTCTSYLLNPHSAPVAVTLLSFSWTWPAPTSGPFRFLCHLHPRHFLLFVPPVSAPSVKWPSHEGFLFWGLFLFPQGWPSPSRFAFLYKLVAHVYKLGHTLSCCLPSVQAGISSLQFRAVFWGIGL